MLFRSLEVLVERWLTSSFEDRNQLSSPDEMGCPGFSSFCFTEIDVPIDLRLRCSWIILYIFFASNLESLPKESWLLLMGNAL